MFSQAIQLSGLVRPALPQADTPRAMVWATSGRFSSKTAVSASKAAANLFGNRLSLVLVIHPVAPDGDLPWLGSQQSDRVRSGPHRASTRSLVLIDQDDLETRLPGQQAHVSSPPPPWPRPQR